MSRAEEIKKFILEQLPEHPKDIVALTARQFSVTRTTVHRHLKTLLAQELILKTGTTITTEYFLRESYKKYFAIEIQPGLSESEIWRKYFGGLEAELPDNVFSICQYGFTEMFNNAIEHSNGRQISVNSELKGKIFTVSIFDDGIGIFKKLKDAFNLKDERESVLQLAKGKLTTDPKNHSGEGIFFSSRVFDTFIILANGLSYIRDNHENDWFFERKAQKNESSTWVQMEIDINSKVQLEDVFKKYVDPETHAFDSTHILVDLSLSTEERFVSRSQARRVLFNIEKFKHILLDFKGVKTVGQAFVDEVFRVFQTKNPDVKIEFINANEDIEFMIRRGVATANENAATPTKSPRSRSDAT